ncbi:MAG: hypothetical protein Kow0067_12810 [Coriobacteriia bacterium]|nr:DUF4418 family protein [Anaerosomatales bacterium]
MVIRVLGIALVIVALLAAVVPAFTNCTAEDLYIQTADGRQIDMKCFWTSRASIAVGIPLAAVGLMLAFSRRVESRRVLGVLGVLLGGALVALPTVLIGVCKMDKLCLNVMKPSLILLGIVAMGLSALALVFARSGIISDDTAS